MASDIFWPSVAAATHLTEETLTELCGNNISTYDGAKRVEDPTAIGGYAMSYDGWYDSVNITDPNQDPYAFEPVTINGLRNFCVEARIFLTDTSSNRTIAARGTATTNGWLFTTYSDGLIFNLSNNAGGSYLQAVAIGVLTTNVWHHVAACISVDLGTVVTVYVDGVAVAISNEVNGTYLQSAAANYPLRVGSAGAAGTSFLGKIQEFRLTLAARYTANFTPLTELFASEPAYFTGTVLDADNQPAVRIVRAHRQSDGASYGEVESSGIDGSFSAPAMDSSPHYIIARGGGENALIFDDVTLA